eukprot:symbB.v1.2.035510.t1/scaffold4791.1/size34851/2
MSVSSSDERLPPEDSTLLRVSRGLGVTFWVCALANGIFLVFTLPKSKFWFSVHKLSGGLLLVLIAFACGLWEVKAMRQKEEETFCTKMVREIFLAAMYFVAGGFMVPATEKPKATEEFVGAALCIFGWLLALLRVVLVLIPCIAKRQPENESLRSNDFPTATTSSSESPAPRRSAAATPLRSERDVREVQTPTPGSSSTEERQQRPSTGFGLCPDIPRYNPDAADKT